MPIEVRLTLEDLDALSREYQANLRHGRALVPEVVSAERTSAAVLVVERVHDGAVLSLAATIAAVFEDGPMRGTALAFDAREDATREALERFVRGEPSTAVTPAPQDALELPSLDMDFEPPAAREEPPAEQDEEADDRATVDPKVVRIRKLPVGERMKLARDGQLEERVLLERLFGKLVWEELLRNPAITPPEVARIANKGTVPRPVLDAIVDNPAWSRQSIVRRALLSNPRVSNDGVAKLLRMTPKAELKMITQGTAYPLGVRGLAKKLLDD